MNAEKDVFAEGRWDGGMGGWRCYWMGRGGCDRIRDEGGGV